MSVICFVSLVHVIWGFGSVLLCVIICFGLLIFTIFSLFLEKKWMFFVKAEFFVSFFCPWLTACSLLMSCSWFLKMTILSVKEGAAAGLLDQKKGKFAWFSHSTETHGNVPCALCVNVCCYIPNWMGGYFSWWLVMLWSCVFMCVCIYLYVCLCFCKGWNSVSQLLPCHLFVWSQQI